MSNVGCFLPPYTHTSGVCWWLQVNTSTLYVSLELQTNLSNCLLENTLYFKLHSPTIPPHYHSEWHCKPPFAQTRNLGSCNPSPVHPLTNPLSPVIPTSSLAVQSVLSLHVHSLHAGPGHHYLTWLLQQPPHWAPSFHPLPPPMHSPCCSHRGHFQKYIR